MLNILVNEARFRLIIETTGPVLIRSGQATILGAKMSPVLTYRKGSPEVFLPGSSLKGVFRSHLEKIICSIKSQVVCDPFWSRRESHKDTGPEALREVRQRDFRPSCGDEFTRRQKATPGSQNGRQSVANSTSSIVEDPSKTHVIYRDSCPACRLFGSTSFIGRVSISDAYLIDPDQEGHIERRDGVGIDRLTGGASNSAKFDADVVSRGVQFIATIHVRNFEVWQLGMLFQVVQDLKDELVRVGSGRSRGLGMVKADFDMEERDGQPGGVTISTVSGEKPANEFKLKGLGYWLDQKQDDRYGTWSDDFLLLSPPPTYRSQGVRANYLFADESLSALQDGAITAFLSRVRKWDRSPALS